MLHYVKPVRTGRIHGWADKVAQFLNTTISKLPEMKDHRVILDSDDKIVAIVPEEGSERMVNVMNIVSDDVK